MEETRTVRVEISKSASKVSESEHQIIIEIPTDVELSEEEMGKIASAVENEIVDIIRGEQAKKLVASRIRIQMHMNIIECK
jgi:hypothetical protein